MSKPYFNNKIDTKLSSDLIKVMFLPSEWVDQIKRNRQDDKYILDQYFITREKNVYTDDLLLINHLHRTVQRAIASYLKIAKIPKEAKLDILSGIHRLNVVAEEGYEPPSIDTSFMDSWFEKYHCYNFDNGALIPEKPLHYDILLTLKTLEPLLHESLWVSEQSALDLDDPMGTPQPPVVMTKYSDNVINTFPVLMKVIAGIQQIGYLDKNGDMYESITPSYNGRVYFVSIPFNSSVHIDPNMVHRGVMAICRDIIASASIYHSERDVANSSVYHEYLKRLCSTKVHGIK